MGVITLNHRVFRKYDQRDTCANATPTTDLRE
jgi:hypothetical protein